jgi:hypothetical protein
MTEKYISFLTRIWKINSQKNAVWRVLLEDPHTHEMRCFDGLDAFFCYLRKITADEHVDLNEHDRSAGK